MRPNSRRRSAPGSELLARDGPTHAARVVLAGDGPTTPCGRRAETVASRRCGASRSSPPSSSRAWMTSSISMPRSPTIIMRRPLRPDAAATHRRVACPRPAEARTDRSLRARVRPQRYRQHVHARRCSPRLAPCEGHRPTSPFRLRERMRDLVDTQDSNANRTGRRSRTTWSPSRRRHSRQPSTRRFLTLKPRARRAASTRGLP